MSEVDRIELQTVTGPIASRNISRVLAHEHMFVDFNPVTDPSYMNVNWSNKIGAAVENVNVLKSQGVDLIVDWTCLGVGRNALALRSVSQQTEVAFLCPTGIYKDFIPPGLRGLSAEHLAREFVQELDLGIDGTGIRAAFIKTAANERGVQSSEEIVLRATAMASVQAKATVGFHGPFADTVASALRMMCREGFNPERLVCAHCQVSSLDENRALADQGATIQYDAIGAHADQFFEGPTEDHEILDRIVAMIEHGHEERILLSTDAAVCTNPSSAQYDRNNAYLYRFFESKLTERIGKRLTRMILRDNPIRAFARHESKARDSAIYGNSGDSVIRKRSTSDDAYRVTLDSPRESPSDDVWHVARKFPSTNDD